MPPISELPDDLLIEIFAQSVVHTSSFNPSLISGPHSPWARALRHKKVLVSVSKRWHLHGIPFLYRQVVIRRAQQLKDLKSTLSQAVTRGSRIFEFCIAGTCYIPDSDVTEFHNILAEVLSLCPNVTRMEVQPLYTLERPPITGMNWNYVTRVDLGSTFRLSSQVNLLTFFGGSIRSLSLHICADDEVSRDHICFPSLEELHFNLRGKTCHESPSALTLQLPLTWTLPVLRSLRIRSENYNISPYLPTLPFVKRHGSRLLHLGIHRDRGHDQEQNDSDIIEILEHCSHLRHLSLNVLPVPSRFPTYQVVFPSIHVLDVFTQGLARDQTDRMRGPSDMQALTFFPSLKVLTFFSYFPVDGFISLPLPMNTNSANVFREACSWLDTDRSWTQVKIAEYKLGTRDGDCSLQIIYPKEGGDYDSDDSDFVPLVDSGGDLSSSASDSDDEEGESQEISSEEIQDLNFL